LSIDANGLLLTPTNNIILLISLNMPLKLPTVLSIVSVVYIMKLEALAYRLHATTSSYDSETLRQSLALKTLLIEICILKDLAVDRGQQEEGGEGLYTRFELYFDVLGAIRVGSPQGYGHNKTQHQEYLYQDLFRKRQQAQITIGSKRSIC
jgi:hypothetical protein